MGVESSHLAGNAVCSRALPPATLSAKPGGGSGLGVTRTPPSSASKVYLVVTDKIIRVRVRIRVKISPPPIQESIPDCYIDSIDCEYEDRV